VPDADLATIVERAVDSLIDATMKQRFAQTKAPQKQRAIKRRTRPRNKNSRYIPRAVIRAVHQRDAGQCTFVSSVFDPPFSLSVGQRGPALRAAATEAAARTTSPSARIKGSRNQTNAHRGCTRHP
jgi:hypothetical protein